MILLDRTYIIPTLYTIRKSLQNNLDFTLKIAYVVITWFEPHPIFKLKIGPPLPKKKHVCCDFLEKVCFSELVLNDKCVVFKKSTNVCAMWINDSIARTSDHLR